MAAEPDYVSGTISLTNGAVEFTGTGTGWLLAQFKAGDTIIDITGATEYMGVVATIDANGAGTLTKAWEGPTLVDAAYRMRYQPDGARVSAQARNLIELLGNGNLQAVAGLSGSANQVIMFTGPGAMTTVPRTDLVSGVAYDVQVDLLTDRDAYDGQAEGFAVLVADVGDGRAAVYSKASASSADWTDPAYVTGPVGPSPTFDVSSTTTLNPGDDATFAVTPVLGGYEIDVGIPAGRGQTPMGDYNPATGYVLDDAVLYNGSTFVALGATTGNAPPTLPTTSNAYWQLLARQGIDGMGTVNSVAAGTGISVNLADPTTPEVSVVAFTGDSGDGGALGGVPPPIAGDAAAGKVLGAAGGWVVPASVPRGHLSGLALSNNAVDATNDIDIAAGECASDGSSPALMTLPLGITKQLDAAWAVGNGSGGLDTGSIANTTYHIWLIKRSDTGVVDALFSTSASAPTMPEYYDSKRRIGSIVRVSAAIKAFAQDGDEFLWKTWAADLIGTSMGTSPTTRVLTVPTGIKVRAILNVGSAGSGEDSRGMLYSPDENEPVGANQFNFGFSNVSSPGQTQNWLSMEMRTGTSSDIKSKNNASSASIQLWLVTRGYIDKRGR